MSTSTTTSNTTYYTWTLGAVGANISGAAAGGANGTVLGTQINQTLDNTGSTAQTATYKSHHGQALPQVHYYVQGHL